jgi:hypothetical protein
LKLLMPSRASVDFIPAHKARAFPHQALTLPIGPLGVLFGNRRHARHTAMAPFATQPPQELALQQLGGEPIGFCPAMLPRYRDTRGMDHVRLDPTRRSLRSAANGDTRVQVALAMIRAIQDHALGCARRAIRRWPRIQTRYAATRTTMFQIAAAGYLAAMVFSGALDRFSGFLTGSTVWTRNTRTAIIRSGCR